MLDRRGSEHRSRQRSSFIACLNDLRHDEYDDARIAADHADMTLHRIDVDDRQALEVIERVIYDHENVWGFPRIGAWMLYRAMRANGIRISLSGIGADDILGSACVEVELDAALRRFDIGRYRELRRVLRGVAGGNIEIGRATAWAEMRWVQRSARAQMRSLLRSACAALHLLEPARRLRRRAHTPTFPRFPAAAIRRDVLERVRYTALSQFDAKRYSDFLCTTPLYLANFDRASAAHGIEVRFPFMDRQLVSYAFSLPERSLNGGGYTKQVLRRAAEGLIPDAIRLHTHKNAFTVPLDQWARGALKPWLLDLCASRAFLESEIWYGPAVRQAVEDAIAGKASLYPVWPILQCHALQQSFVARACEVISPTPECDSRAQTAAS
jgi:asparagine synthase (glutamine-hydrolysing)